jgi:hypothetical protein
MDVRAILKARNLTDDQANVLMNDPAYATLLETFITEAENGKTAMQKAQEIEGNLTKWYNNDVVTYVRSADERAAKAEARVSEQQQYLKSMKGAGYDVPEAWLEAQQTPSPKSDSTPSSGISKEDFDKRTTDVAMTNMALVSLSNRHRKLTGDELDLDTEYTDFQANRRPEENLRTYVARKYDHAGLQKKADDAREQKKLDDYAAEKIQSAKAEWAAANGSNPEIRNPRASRWDGIRADEGRTQLWQTAKGREEATRRRLEKYQNLVQ